MTMIYSNPAREQDAATTGAQPDVEVFYHDCTDSAAPCPFESDEQLAEFECGARGWNWRVCNVPGEFNGPFDTEAEAIADAREDARTSEGASRQCIGCACHRVVWNQGSDYCDECLTDDHTQREPHDASPSDDCPQDESCGPECECECATCVRKRATEWFVDRTPADDWPTKHCEELQPYRGTGKVVLLPPCVLAMGCYCAGHARGNPASGPCDTSEHAPDADDDFISADDKDEARQLGSWSDVEK